MPTNEFKQITGLNHLTAFDGIDITAIPGTLAQGPNVAVIFGTAEGLPPNDPTITIQIFPTGASANGTDSFGNIGVNKTIVNDGDDKTYSVIGGGSIVFPNGMLASKIRVVVNNENGTRDITIQSQGLNPNDPLDWPGVAPPPDSVLNLNASGPDENGYVTLTWDETDDSVILYRSKDGGDKKVIGSLPGPSSEFIDNPLYNGEEEDTGEGSYEYYIKTYDYIGPTLNGETGPAGPIEIGPPPPTPDINVTMDGGIALGGTTTIVFIGDPSGIYTLVPGKTHDTLYERTDIDFQDVAIPNPFVKTAFLG